MKRNINFFLFVKKLLGNQRGITLYQLKSGNKEEWVTLEQFQRDYKEKQITKILMRNNHGANKSIYEIKSTKILPLSCNEGANPRST